MKLLHIIASPRGAGSRTLTIGRAFLGQLKEQHPGLSVDTLDLFRIRLPEIDETVVDAKYGQTNGNGTPSVTARTEMMQYAKAFLTYDAYLITCPMWNLTVPYKLKHYIDVIVQAGVLFRFTETGIEGLVKNKRMYCITSRGSDYSPGGPAHQYDFQEPYLRAIFGYVGIYDISFIHAQPLDYTPEIRRASLDKAMEEARSLARSSALLKDVC